MMNTLAKSYRLGLRLLLGTSMACGTEEAPRELALEPLEADPAFAVVSTDFASTSIGVLDAAGNVQRDSWFNSGSTSPGLTAALGGDVVLPTAQANDGTFAVIDRFGTDVVTRVRFDGTLVGQIRLNPPATSIGFSANPQDFVVVDAARGWASRYEQNPDGQSDPLDMGGDLIGIDPSSMTLNGERIDLTVFNETVGGFEQEFDDDGAPLLVNGEPVFAEVAVAINARPSRMVHIRNYLVVGLSRLPADLFGPARGFGEGLVAVVDTTDGSVEGYSLAGLADCGRVVSVADSPDDVLVGCGGYAETFFGDEGPTRATTGIVRLTLGVDGSIREAAGWRASEDVRSALASRSIVSLGGDSVMAVAFGDDVTGTNDRVFQVDLATGMQTLLFEADGQFDVGDAAFDGQGLLLVPDAASGTVRRFAVSGGSVTEESPIVLEPTDLPPRQVYAL